MSDRDNIESLLDIYIFETSQLLDQLEQSILSSEKTGYCSAILINEIFRITHTIKGSSAMMHLDNISSLAHFLEDLFYFIREEELANVEIALISDVIFECVDFIKLELVKIKNADVNDGDVSGLVQKIRDVQSFLKADRDGISESNSTALMANFKAVIFFEDGCDMENIRAFTIVNSLTEISPEVSHFPLDILDNDETADIIRVQGFTISFKTDQSLADMNNFFGQIPLLKSFELVLCDEQFAQLPTCLGITDESSFPDPPEPGVEEKPPQQKKSLSSLQTSIISVNVAKLDKLMDLVGELVIAEAMVTQNTDLKNLELDNFRKAARQLEKITGELQDMVMSIRMVPLAATFHKMSRIVRDMGKKLNKQVSLEIIGETTEVDKNIIEHISDPLMHLIRNAIDHGIETAEERKSSGKPEPAKVTLEAKNAGGDVLVIVKDNGKGLNKAKILERAKENGLIYKPETEMTDREIYSLIFLPGFSTKDLVSEFSGRGVGMDVVSKNIQTIGGSVTVDSQEGLGSSITLKIPLTLAIIEGMNLSVGKARYTIPLMSIKESFRPQESDIIIDPAGNEMILVRGQCYPIVRLHKRFRVATEVTDLPDGIITMVENDEQTFCIFADELIGEQQVVVKALPEYIKNIRKIDGLSGCTLLGDGNISLILDVPGLMQ